MTILPMFSYPQSELYERSIDAKENRTINVETIDSINVRPHCTAEYKFDDYFGFDGHGRQDFCYDVFENSPGDLTRCVYCDSTMSDVEGSPGVDWERTKCSERVSLRHCARCGWWRYHQGLAFDKERFGNAPETFFVSSADRAGICRTYADCRFGPALADLRQWLNQHPDDPAHRDPALMARLIASSLRAQHGDLEVTQLARRDDQGIDILLARNDRVAIPLQVKRRLNLPGLECLDVVRSLNGVLVQDGVPSGLVLTTVSAYTPGPLRDAGIFVAGITKTIFRRFRVTLAVADGLARLLRLDTPLEAPPWTSFLPAFHALAQDAAARGMPEPPPTPPTRKKRRRSP